MMQSADVIAWDQTRNDLANPSIRDVRPLYDTLLTTDDNDNLQYPFLVTEWEFSMMVWNTPSIYATM